MPLSRRGPSSLRASGAPRALGSSLFGLVFLATTASAAEEPRCTTKDLPVNADPRKNVKSQEEYDRGRTAKDPGEKEHHFREANGIVRCHPERVLALAKLLDEQGRLGEALATYELITQTDPESFRRTWVDAVKDAKDKATKIARVTFVFQGAIPEGTRVEVDGTAVDPMKPHFVREGEHAIKIVSEGYDDIVQTPTIKGGQFPFPVAPNERLLPPPPPDPLPQVKQGLAHAKDGNWKRALAAFVDAADQGGDSAVLLYYRAHCERELGHGVRAGSHFNEYLDKEDRPGTAVWRSRAERSLAQIKRDRAVAIVTISSAGVAFEDSVLLVDGAPIRAPRKDPRFVLESSRPVASSNAARSVELHVSVDPGEHTFAVQGEGLKPESKTLTFERGQRTPLTLPLSPLAVEPRPSPPMRRATVGKALFGLGVAGLAVGAVSGVVGIAERVRLPSLCPQMNCSSAASHGALDTIHATALVVDVALPVGVVLAPVGFALWKPRSLKARASAGAPRVTVSARGVTIGGAF
jgi:hypothetical protein